jgi:outer membrane protein
VNYASYGLSTGITVFNGLGILYNIKANALGFEAARWELQQEKDNITLNVILAYLQVLNNSDLLVQAGNTTTVTQLQVNRLEIMNDQGAIAPALLYDLRGQLASDRLALINTRNTLNAAKLTLSQLLNVPFDSALTVERVSIDQFNPEYTATVENIYQTALQQLSIMKAAQLRTQSAEKNIKAIKGDFYPNLGLSGQATTNYSSAASQNIFVNNSIDSIGFVTINGNNAPVNVLSNNFANEKIKYKDQLSNNVFTTFNLGLRIPIFNNLQTRTRVRQAQITQKNYQYIESTARIQLKQNIEQAYFNMTAARERYLALLEQVNAFTQSFRAAEIRFNAGAGTTVDYIIAKNNLDRANINLITARYDFLLRTKVLDYYQAKPLW